MRFLEAILVAASLCADCFAVSLCSGTSFRRGKGSLSWLALAFASIQTGLLLAGWLAGSTVYSFVDRWAGWIAFLLLLYVGGSMFIGGVEGKDESMRLDGFRNVVLAGIATSIDAAAVGAASSMAGSSSDGIRLLLPSVFVVTALSVFAGILGGRTLGRRYGSGAEIAGGIILVAIGVANLCTFPFCSR